MSISKALLNISADMLDMAADEYASHVCNDYEITNTPENLNFVKDMIRSGFMDGEELEGNENDSMLSVSDFNIMSYCAYLLRTEKELL